MSYKKYIKRGDKTYGPYSYKSVKVNGKVTTEYLGKFKVPKKNNSLKFIIPFFAILLFGIFLLNNFNLTGKVSMDLQNSYSPGEQIKGNLKINLEQGELLPLSTKVVINNSGDISEYTLANLVKDYNLSEGNFYLKNKDISGTGEGFGIAGEKISYPDVDFVLKIINSNIGENNSGTSINETNSSTVTSENFSSGNSEIQNQNTTENNSPETSTQIQENSSSFSEQQTTSIESTTTNSETNSNQESSSLPITGDVISENENLINGAVSKNNPYSYGLSDGQTAEIVSSDKEVKLEIKDSNAIVTTNYEETEKGFGEEYLGNDNLNLNINLDSLNLTAKDGELVVILNYNNTDIISTKEKINVKENETILNETLTNETAVNTTINTTQYGAVINKPVKWKKTITLDENSNESLSVELPKEAENIAVYKMTQNNSESELSSDNVSVEIIKEKVPEENVNILTGQISAELNLHEENRIKNFFKKIFGSITGKTVDIQETNESMHVVIDENATQFEIQYETPGPVSNETNKSYGKEIVISSDIHYQNILAYTELSEPTDLSKIKLYNVDENGSRILTLFNAYDYEGNEIKTKIENVNETFNFSISDIINETDTNSSIKNENLVSYIEWVVPHLSEEKYELVIATIDAQHLDENRTFISDIYNETSALDGNWSEEIKPNEYVRVTFERPLTNKNDITIYAKGNNSAVEVYREDGNESIALMENISYENWHKTYLTLLDENESYITFDLKILNSSVWFDYIIDPFQDNTSLQQIAYDCGTINTTNGYYRMNQSVTASTSCFTVNADNITLDCQGFNITYSTGGAANTYGVTSARYNTTIKNCKIIDGTWTIAASAARYGIYFNTSAANYSTIYNSTINISTSAGIYLLTNANFNNVSFNNVTSNSSYGIFISASSNNTLVNNVVTSNSSIGIYLVTSQWNNLTGNTGKTNTSTANLGGIVLSVSGNNTLTGNTGISSFSTSGINFSASSNNTLTNNNGTSYSGSGISISTSSNNNLTGNNGTSYSGVGIFLTTSSNNNTLTSNNGTNFGASYGIEITTSGNNTLINNNGTSSTGAGIYLLTTQWNNLTGNIGRTNSVTALMGGIRLDSGNNTLKSNIGLATSTIYGIILNTAVSSSNTLIGNNGTSNSSYGIYLITTANNTLTNNTGTSNSLGAGIYLSASSNNTLTNNNGTGNISTTSYGIYLTTSQWNNLTGNIGKTYSATATISGIYLNSGNNTLTGNTGISTSGAGGIILFTSADKNNLTNNNGTSVSGSGIYLSTSSNNTLVNNNGTSTSLYGIGLLTSSDNNLTGNNGTSNASIGIYLLTSAYRNNLTGNKGISNYSYGIEIATSGNNTLTNNNGTSNSSSGIYLASGQWNNLTGNNGTTSSTTANDGGIRLDSGNNTLINNLGVSTASTTGIILFTSANSNNLTNNNGTSNTGSGIYLSSASYNNLTSNNASSYNSYALYLSSANNNTIYKSNLISTLTHSLYVSSSTNNTISNNVITSGGYYGIYFVSGDNYNTISSNTIASYSASIILLSGANSFNYIINNTANNQIYITGGNNTIVNNNATSTGNSIYLITGQWNNFTGNIGITSSATANTGGIYIGSGNNTFTNNIGISTSSTSGITLQAGANNNLTNNNGTSATGYGIYFYNASNNTLINQIAVGTSAGSYGVYIISSNNTAFQDCTNISGVSYDIYYATGTMSINNTFLNCSYNLSKETIVPATGQLIRKWYYQAYVNYSNGTALNGVNVSAYNSSGTLEFTTLTNSSGYTPIKSITEYVNLGGTRGYSSNYSINATLTGYANYSKSINITGKSNVMNDFLTMSLDTTAPTYNNSGINQTNAGSSSLFSLYINDNIALDPLGQYIFSTNNSGVWANDSAVNFTATPSWANATKVLNSTSGIAIGYMWYLTDNLSNMNNTGVYSFITDSLINCANLSTANSYYPLQNNLTSSGTCIIISAANITLDCKGYWINYSINGSENAYGIYTNQTNTTIKNCKIIDGNWTKGNPSTRYGIDFDQASNGTIFNNFVNTSNATAIYIAPSSNFNNISFNNATSNSSSGIYLYSNSNNTLINNIGTGNYNNGSTNGITLWLSNNNILLNNIGIGTGNTSSDGIYIYQSSTNNFTNNNGTSNSDAGIYVDSGSNNNIFINNSGTTNTSVIYMAGIYIYNASNNLLINNTGIGLVAAVGIYIRTYSSNNTLIGNNGTSNYNADQGDGILLYEYTNNNILINNTGTGYGVGIYLDYYSINNTLTGNNGTSYGSANTRHGILFYENANNNTLINNIGINTKTGGGVGIYLNNVSNMMLINNNGTCVSDSGIEVTTVANSTLINNTGTTNTYRGINVKSTSYNNTFINNIGIGQSGYGIYILQASNNTFINNTGVSNSNNGISISTSSNNTFTNNTAISNTTYALYILSLSGFNTFTNQTAIGLLSGSTGITLRNSANNTFVDCGNISGVDYDVYYYPINGSTNETFINCPYNLSKEFVNTTSNGELTRKWYYLAYVNDSSGTPLVGANVSAYNVSSVLSFTDLTNSSGYTPVEQLMEYINLAGTRIYSSNYTINATLMGYNNYFKQFNFTGIGNNLNDFITMDFDTIAPNVFINSPTPTTYTTSSVLFDISTDENSTCNYSLNSGISNYSLIPNATGTGHTASRELPNANYIVNFYCSDLTGNQNNTMNVPFTVNVPSSITETPANEGGGGSSIFKPATAFNLSTNLYEINMPVNKIEFGRIEITNTGDLKDDFEIKTEGLENILSVDKNKILLNSGQSGYIEFKLYSPATAGIYTGKIIVNAGSLKKEIEIIANVNTEKSLFDVILSIPKSEKSLGPGKPLDIQVDLTQMGTNREKVDVTLNYVIKDFKGNTAYTESETIAVENQSVHYKELPTEGLLPGDYVAGVEVIYKDGVAVASSQFSVKEKINLIESNGIILVCLALAVIFALTAMAIIIKRYKKVERHTKYIKERGK